MLTTTSFTAPTFPCTSCSNPSPIAVPRGAHLPRIPLRAARRARRPLRHICSSSAASDDTPQTDLASTPATSPPNSWHVQSTHITDGTSSSSSPTHASHPHSQHTHHLSQGPNSQIPHITSLSLNLNGRDALPSVASLIHYMNDLRPKLDYLDPRSRGRVLSALEVANVAHDGQLRKSGEPFIIHPIAVAAILAEMHMDRDCIIAGLLHDTVEDTPVTLDDVETLFGADVRRIVEGETKLTKLAKNVHSAAACSHTETEPEAHSATDPIMQKSSTEPTTHSLRNLHTSNSSTNPASTSASIPASSIPPWQRERQKREEEQQKQADNLRAMFMAMTEDVRVIIVKLADRLHNMRTLAHMSVAKQKKISKETLEFFAPLAHRLGMRRIKSELEELSFMYLHPEEYAQLKSDVETLLKRSNVEHYLKSAEAIIKDVLHQDRILYNMIRSVQVIGSTKELYSIFRRMQAGETLGSMLDIASMRVVVDLDPGLNSNQACYHVLGRIHNMWKPLPKRLKDYIAFPKPNGYQSLHTTVLLGQKFDFFALEFQIRTAEMHRIAEEGIAAEVFKTGPGLDKTSMDESENELDAEWRRRTKGWLISIREYLEEFSSSKDLVDAVRKDLLGNRVFVFTPKGRIIDLPKDSTPVDVAYRIHSDVGDSMIGVKVNGKIVDLDYKLQNADVVKIMSSSCAKGPSPEWISYAKSRTARQKIRQFLRARDRDNMLDRGRRLLEEEARGMIEPVPSEAGLSEIMPRLAAVASSCHGVKNIVTVDDLYVEIAKGETAGTKYKLERTVLGLLRDRRHTEISGVVRTSDGKADTDELRDSPTRRGAASENVRMSGNLEMILSPCCHPIRGDEVVGVHLQGGSSEAVLVHRRGCRHLQTGRPHVGLRWAVQRRELDDGVEDGSDVPQRRSLPMHVNRRRIGSTSSEDEVGATHLVRMIVIARDCTGLLAYISGVLASVGTSIRRSSTVTDAESMLATLAFEVLVRDTYHTRRILERIEECEEVESAQRLGPNESGKYFGILPGDLGGSPAGVDVDGVDEMSLRLLRGGVSVAADDLEIGVEDVEGAA